MWLLETKKLSEPMTNMTERDELSPSRHAMGGKASIASRDGVESFHHVTRWEFQADGHVNQISKKNFCDQDEKTAMSRRSYHYADVVKSEKVRL